MLGSGNIYIIAAISNFGLIFSYILASFAVFHFRRVKAQAQFRTPFYPYTSIIAVLLLFAIMAGMPREALIFGTLSVLVLLIFYYFMRELKEKKVVRIYLFR
jgi:APA family basic amino acid/polyamine antiporter